MNNRFLKPKAVLAGENLKYSFCCSFENMESYAFFILPSSLRAKTTASTNAAASAIGPAYMTPSIPINIGKMTISGSRKDHLSGQRHDDTKTCLSYRSKKSGGHWLDTIGESQEHKNPQIVFCKFKVQITSAAKHA